MRARETIDLDAVRWAIRNGCPVMIPDIDVTVCDVLGKRLCFASDRENDPIQRENRKGLFYEDDELVLIRDHFPKGGTFVDVGANIGNHSLFVAAFLAPTRIIPFEPNPPAYKLLVANVVMNGFLDRFDFSHLGFGLADMARDGFSMTPQTSNLGGARMQAGGGDIQSITGDAALADVTPDFIKIDVEGMEMQVLEGLAATIERTSPTMLIEVDQRNDAAFGAWLERHSYTVRKTIQRYSVNRNVLVKKRVSS